MGREGQDCFPSPGVKAGSIQWPAPEKLTVKDITTYVYHGEAVLLVPLTIEAGLSYGLKMK